MLLVFGSRGGGVPNTQVEATRKAASSQPLDVRRSAPANQRLQRPAPRARSRVRPPLSRGPVSVQGSSGRGRTACARHEVRSIA